MSKLIHQIEDKFFKKSLSDLRVAKDFFESHLPEKILEKLDLNSLVLQNQSFIDESYKDSEADIVYSALISGELGYFYILCEHQSKIDNHMALRLLKYCLRIIDNHLQQNSKSELPIVYPIVVYTGEKKWDVSLDIFELFQDANLARDTLLNPLLIDIQRLEDAEIKKHLWSGLAEYALKYRKQKDSEKFYNEILPWLELIELHTGVNYGKVVLFYLYQTVGTENIELFEDMTNKHLSGKLRGEAMTLAQAYEQRGEQRGYGKGLIEGRNEERLEIAKKLIARGSTLEDVAEITGLSIVDLQLLFQQENH